MLFNEIRENDNNFIAPHSKMRFQQLCENSFESFLYDTLLLDERRAISELLTKSKLSIFL